MSKKMYSFTKNIFILSTSVGPKTGTYFFLFHCVHFLRILLNGLPSQTLWNLQLKHFFFFSACHCLFRWSNWFFNGKITSRIQISARKTVFNRGVYLNKYKFGRCFSQRACSYFCFSWNNYLLSHRCFMCVRTNAPEYPDKCALTPAQSVRLSVSPRVVFTWAVSAAADVWSCGRSSLNGMRQSCWQA